MLKALKQNHEPVSYFESNSVNALAKSRAVIFVLSSSIHFSSIVPTGVVPVLWRHC